MNKTYLFYDLETTGLNKCFDQVLQFAAIRTDDKLNEIEKHEFLIKLNPDVIPSPKATITHQIDVNKLDGAINEYEATTQIHQLMNQPNTISLGYNTLKFDDEFLRFSFYRNLLSPYTHQYANGCSRMDIYPMTVMYFLYKNEALNWPVIDNKTSLKLENLSAANQLAAGEAHDAMVDVKATVALAQKLHQYGDIWQYLAKYFQKDIDQQRLNKLSTALMIDGSFGSDNYYQIPVLALGRHNHYKNQTLWLRLDTEDLVKTSEDNIPEKTFVKFKKDAELGLLLPINDRFKRYLAKERLEMMHNNLSWLEKNSQILTAIAHYYKEYKYPIIPNVDIDAKLYQINFPSFSDTAQCTQFHQADITDKAKAIENIENPIYHEQAIRVLGRNYPEHLPNNYLADFQEYLQLSSNSIDYHGEKRLSADVALAEIDELMHAALTFKQQQLLQSLATQFQP